MINRFNNLIFFIATTSVLLLIQFYNQFSLNVPTLLFYKVSWKLPFLLSSNQAITALIACLILVIGLMKIDRPNLKKIITTTGLTAIMLFFFSWQTLLAFLGVNILLFLALSKFQKNSLHFYLLVALSIFSLVLVFLYFKLNPYSYFLLIGQIIFGFYSALIDKIRGHNHFSIMHFWILLFCFPGGLFTIIYGYKNFSESYLSESYSETLAKGLYLISLAILQLMTIQLIELHSLPNYSLLRNKVSTIAFSNATTLELWMIGFKLLFFFIFEQVATINLIQGVTQVFGYNVERQIDGLWKANSFLDVWKRGSHNTRMYWINYIYMPLLLRTKNIYISDLSVWIIYGVIASIAYGGINLKYVKPDSLSEIWITIFFKHSILFGLASCIEMFLTRNVMIIKNSASWKKALVRIILFIIMIITYIIGNEFGPNSNNTLQESINVILKMLGLL